MSGGELPQGWRRAQLGEATTIVGGSTPASGVMDYWNGNIDWITPTDLGELNGKLIQRSSRRITRAGFSACSTAMLPVGTVVMSSRAPIGHLGIAGVPLCTNQGCKSFIPGPDVHSRFLFWSLKRKVPAIQALGTGNTFAEVSKSKLATVQLSFPPLPEQRRIADAIDTAMAEAEAAAYAIQAQTTDLDGLEFRIFEDAFPVRPVALNQAEDAPEGWTWRPLTSVARLESGHTPSRRHPEWWGGDTPWIALPDIRAFDGATACETLETINEGGLANSSARLLPTGTVCLSRTASVGFVTVMGLPMATSQDFVNWVPSPMLDSWFLAYALMAARPWIRELASGATHKTIYMPTLKALRICLPELRRQEEIVNHIEQCRAELRDARAALAAQQTAVSALPAAILSAAFRGQL